jgi:hypothetical protein
MLGSDGDQSSLASKKTETGTLAATNVPVPLASLRVICFAAVR